MPPAPRRREPPSGKYHQFLWTASQPIQLCDKGAVRRDATRNRAESSQVRGQFRAPPPMQLPRGLWLLLYNQDAAQCRVGPPHQKARPARLGAKETRCGGERASLAKLAKPPNWGGA